MQLVDAGRAREARAAAIGMTMKWNLLFVVHVSGKGSTLRIISARVATPSERRTYENE